MPGQIWEVGDLCSVGAFLQLIGAPCPRCPLPQPSFLGRALCQTIRPGRVLAHAAKLLSPQPTILHLKQLAVRRGPALFRPAPIRRTGPVYPLSPLGFSDVVLNQVPTNPATGLCRTSTVGDIAIDTLKILSFFFRPRCSPVSEETFDLVGVRHAKFQALGASFELDTPL